MKTLLLLLLPLLATSQYFTTTAKYSKILKKDVNLETRLTPCEIPVKYLVDKVLVIASKDTQYYYIDSTIYSKQYPNITVSTIYGVTEFDDPIKIEIISSSKYDYDLITIDREGYIIYYLLEKMKTNESFKKM